MNMQSSLHTTHTTSCNLLLIPPQATCASDKLARVDCGPPTPPYGRLRVCLTVARHKNATTQHHCPILSRASTQEVGSSLPQAIQPGIARCGTCSASGEIAQGPKPSAMDSNRPSLTTFPFCTRSGARCASNRAGGAAGRSSAQAAHSQQE